MGASEGDAPHNYVIALNHKKPLTCADIIGNDDLATAFNRDVTGAARPNGALRIIARLNGDCLSEINSVCCLLEDGIFLPGPTVKTLVRNCGSVAVARTGWSSVALGTVAGSARLAATDKKTVTPASHYKDQSSLRLSAHHSLVPPTSLDVAIHLIEETSGRSARGHQQSQERERGHA